MREQVAVQMILAFEGLMAHCTQIFPLVTVRQPVLGQGGGVPKHLIAQVTFLGTSFAGFIAVGGGGGVLG